MIPSLGGWLVGFPTTLFGLAVYLLLLGLGRERSHHLGAFGHGCIQIPNAFACIRSLYVQVPKFQ